MSKQLTFGIGLSIVLISNLALGDEVAYECKTNKVLARILKSSDGIFKYLAWNKPKSVSDKPDVELSQKDAADMQGTGPCVTTYYTFKKGDVEYSISDNLNCVESKPPAGAKGKLIVKIKNQEKDHFWCFK